MNVSMSGKVVLVTGASQGLGETVAMEFAKSGADLAIVYNSQADKAESVSRAIGELGSRVLSVKCDVSNPAQVRAMVQRVVDELGKIDVLVNNAAVNPKKPEGKTAVYEISDEEWEWVLSVNLRGAFLCTREVLKDMIQHRSGSIVNVASLSGQVGNGAPVGAPYCVSKAGMICLTKSTALDVARFGIRVNAVAPGPFEGPTNRKNTPEVNAAMAAKIPLGRIAKPEEIAYAVIFLASELSGSTTGQTLSINGGWYMP
jgi:3-oxoacyl-[acyl-carrier protein] reductase